MTGLVLQLTGHMAYTRPFKSSKHPESKIIDRMCQVNVNLMRPSVRLALLLSARAREANIKTSF
jgi:hypothetical protein